MLWDGKRLLPPAHTPHCTLRSPGEPPQGRCSAAPHTRQHRVLQNLQLTNSPARCRALNNSVLESPRGDVRSGFPYAPFQLGAPSPNKLSAAASATAFSHLQPQPQASRSQPLELPRGAGSRSALMTQQTAIPGVTRLLASQQDQHNWFNKMLRR